MNPSRTPVKLVLALVALMVGILLLATGVIGRLNPGPAQPVPFSHHVHATTKQLSCFFCQTYAAKSTNAGMPSVAKCMLCHKVVASNFAPIAKLRGYYDQNQGVPWVRVNQLPDFVHFSHEVHVAKGFDCRECHGNVKEMDRITPAHTFNMDFCVSCHWNNKESTDCILCHY